MRRGNIVLPVVLFLSLTLIAAYVFYSNRTREYSSDRFLMDTLISIKVYGSDSEALKEAVASAYSEMHRIASLTDAFPKIGTPEYRESDACRINQQAGVAPVVVDKDTFKILKMAKHYSELSEGAFDVTVGPLMDLWGFGGKNPHIPSPESIKSALSLVNSRDLILNEQERTAFLAKRGMKLDLGAIAKGYATEKAIQSLKASGISKALIDAGGNIRVLGRNLHGTQWRIGIKDPRKQNAVVAILQLEDSSAVTSGDYYRFFEVDGKRYHHIIDPRSGYPAGENMTVTTLTADAALADVLSTLFFVLPPEKAVQMAENLDGVDLFLITDKRRIMHTQSLKGKIDVPSETSYRYDQRR
ncbi:MAG: FAD:protein FMN transferase [Desulfuromonadaceae bacterium]|nr:FAD:protein FMN transferase [Desulfuromonadaceae bacterium]MDD2855238.1 FAD:protein FMN transferase [Desulfuromonadaceae bacterium]